MAKEEQAVIIVQVQPNAGQNRLIRYENGILHLRIAAPPQRGKANRELVRFLSDLFNVPKSNLVIETGITARRKTLVITGLTQTQVTDKFTEMKL